MINRYLGMLIVCFLNAIACLGQTDIDVLISTIEIVSEKIRIEGANSSHLKIRGWAYYSLDSLDEAMEDYNEAIQLDMTDHDLYFRRGDIFFAMRKFNDAIFDYSKAIKLSSSDSLTYYVSRAVTYEEIGEYAKALADYNIVLNKAPHDELALRNRAILLCGSLKQFEKGLVDWSNLIKLYPRADYYSDRGLIFMQRRNLQSALTDFDNAFRLEPDNLNYLTRRAYCLGMTGEFTRSLDDFKYSQQRNSNNAFLYKYRGEVLLKKGDKIGGCADIAKAKEMGLDVDTLLANCQQK